MYDRAIILSENGWMYDDGCEDFIVYAKENGMDMVFSSADEISHGKTLSQYDSYCVMYEVAYNGMSLQMYAILEGDLVYAFVEWIKDSLDCDGEAYYIYNMKKGKRI